MGLRLIEFSIKEEDGGEWKSGSKHKSWGGNVSLVRGNNAPAAAGAVFVYTESFSNADVGDVGID
jgi:hypothetical protein